MMFLWQKSRSINVLQNPSFRGCSHLKFLFMYCILYISVEAISVVHIYTLTYDHPWIETMSSDFKSRANVPVGIIFISWSINERMDTWSIWYPVTAAAIQEMSMTFWGNKFWRSFDGGKPGRPGGSSNVGTSCTSECIYLWSIRWIQYRSATVYATCKYQLSRRFPKTRIDAQKGILRLHTAEVIQNTCLMMYVEYRILGFSSTNTIQCHAIFHLHTCGPYLR